MRARDIMSRPVISIDRQTTIREAITLLTEHGFSAVPVVDQNGRVAGIFSESDALRANANGSSRDTLVTTKMTTPVEVVSPTAEVGAIAERMLADRLRCVPVVEEGLLIGVVSRRDLLRTLVRDDDVITANIRALLDDYAGSRRHWRVEVTDANATISGEFADNAEQSIVTALTRTVPGVTEVQLNPTAGISISWDD